MGAAMQIPFLIGSKKDPKTSHTITTFPQNTYHKDGKLRTVSGLIHFSDLPALDRNGYYINSGFLQGHFRVAGNRLCEIRFNGEVIEHPDLDIVGNDRAVFAASVYNLGFVAGGGYYLYNPNEGLRQVMNTQGAGELGEVLDITWIRQSFILLVYRADQNAVYMQQCEVGQDSTIKSIRSEIDDSDPDRSVSIEAESDYFVLFNKNTITFWQYQITDPDKFSYAPALSKQIEGGLIGRDAKARILGTWAILSNNVPGKEPNIYLLGTTLQPIGTIEVQNVIKSYSVLDLEAAVLEGYEQDGIDQLLVHLPNHTLLYNAQTQLWITLTSLDDNYRDTPYRAKNIVRDERTNNYIVGDKYKPILGKVDDQEGSEYDRPIIQIIRTPYLPMNIQVRHLCLEGVYGNWPCDHEPLITISASAGGMAYTNSLDLRLPKGHNYVEKLSAKGVGSFRGNVSFRVTISTNYTLEFADQIFINESADALVKSA
jgi:hypothetical protein